MKTLKLRGLTLILALVLTLAMLTGGSALAEEEPELYRVRDIRLLIRVDAMYNADRLGSVAPGEVVEVIFTSDIWAYVRTEDGTEGYVLGYFLSPYEAEPSQEPTLELFVEPTEEPTPEPVIEPTEEPTPEPVIEPTDVPVTPEPTPEFTPEPTPVPTPTPTLQPLPTREPGTTPRPIPPTATPFVTQESTPTPTPEPTPEPTPKVYYATVTADSAYIRAEASAKSEALDVVTMNDEVEVLAVEDNWAKVRTSRAVEGYINLKYLEGDLSELIAEASAAPDIAFVTAGLLNIRASAGVDAEIIGTAQQGDELEILSVDGDWAQIRTSEGVEGYVHRNYLSDEQPAVEETPEESPEASAEESTDAEAGQPEEADAEEPTDEAAEQPEESKAEESTDADTEQPEEADAQEGDLVITGEMVNLRAEPSALSQIVTILREQDHVQGLSTEGNWVMVRIADGREGYVNSQFLSGELPAAEEEQNADGEASEPQDEQNPDEASEPQDEQNPDETAEPQDEQNPDETAEPQDEQNPDDAVEPQDEQDAGDEAATSMQVTADSLNIRSGPSASAEPTGALHMGDIVQVLGSEGSWTHIHLDDGTEGYVSSKYLAEPGTVTAPEAGRAESEGAKEADLYVVAEEPELPDVSFEYMRDESGALALDDNGDPVPLVPEGTEEIPAVYQRDNEGALVLDDSGLPKPTQFLPVTAQLISSIDDERHPGRSVDIYLDSGSGQLSFGDQVTIIALLHGYDGLDYKLRWQVSEDGTEWLDVPGATTSRLTFEITEDNYRLNWRVLDYVAGE